MWIWVYSGRGCQVFLLIIFIITCLKVRFEICIVLQKPSRLVIQLSSEKPPIAGLHVHIPLSCPAWVLLAHLILYLKYLDKRFFSSIWKEKMTSAESWKMFLLESVLGHLQFKIQWGREQMNQFPSITCRFWCWACGTDEPIHQSQL